MIQSSKDATMALMSHIEILRLALDDPEIASHVATSFAEHHSYYADKSRKINDVEAIKKLYKMQMEGYEDSNMENSKVDLLVTKVLSEINAAAKSNSVLKNEYFDFFDRAVNKEFGKNYVQN